MNANQNTPTPLLLVRRNMLRDEWVPDFFRHLVQSNGLSRLSPSDLPEIERTVMACAAPTDRSYRHHRRRSLTATTLTQPFPHVTIPKSAALRIDDVFRVCPVCMVEEPYARRLWRIRCFDICTRHHCFLVDLDDHLRHSIEVSLDKADGDRERFAWLRMSTSFKPCSALEMDSHCNLWQGVEFHEEHEPDFQEGLGWALLINDVLDRMREPPLTERRDHPAGRSIKKAIWYRQALSLSLLGSVQGVRELIDRSSHSSDLKAIEKALKMAIDARKRGATVFDGLPLVDLQEYLIRTRPQTRDRSASARIQSSRASTKSDLSRLEAMRTIDVPNYQFDEWVQKGALKATYWSQVLSEDAPRFDRGQITAVKRFLTYFTPLDRFCKEYAMAPSTVCALAREGLLATIVVERTRKVDCRSAWHLIDALQCQARPILEAGVPTHPLFYAAEPDTTQSQAHLVGVLKDVLVGNGLLFRDIRKRGFSSFRVPVPTPATPAMESASVCTATCDRTHDSAATHLI